MVIEFEKFSTELFGTVVELDSESLYRYKIVGRVQRLD